MIIFVPRSRFYDFPGELTAEVVDSALRVLGKLVQTFTGEKLVGHTVQRQPVFSSVRQAISNTERKPLRAVFEACKEFYDILMAFTQKNAASKPSDYMLFILCSFPDHKTHSGF